MRNTNLCQSANEITSPRLEKPSLTCASTWGRSANAAAVQMRGLRPAGVPAVRAHVRLSPGGGARTSFPESVSRWVATSTVTSPVPRAAGLVCLGAGAGLIRGDLLEVRGTDVACRSGGVVVVVRGGRPRAVPVLARYHPRLLAAARSAGTGLVCGGTDPGRRNLTNPLVRALDASRLRATRHPPDLGIPG